MKIRKVKYDGSTVTVIWEVEGTSGDKTRSELESTQQPEPELVDALERLLDDVLELCELPSGYRQGMRVTGLSVTWAAGEDPDVTRMGVVVTCMRSLKHANGPLVLNTPYVSEPNEKMPDDPKAISDDMHAHVMEVLLHARRFVEGARAQRNLYGGEAA